MERIADSCGYAVPVMELTEERDLIPDTGTYGERSTLSTRTPGALVRELALTL